jgi:hypothetical protein
MVMPATKMLAAGLSASMWVLSHKIPQKPQPCRFGFAKNDSPALVRYVMQGQLHSSPHQFQDPGG